MALYVDTDYWVVGYAEGDVAGEEPTTEPRIIQLRASLSIPPSPSASITVIPGYTATLTDHSTLDAG